MKVLVITILAASLSFSVAYYDVTASALIVTQETVNHGGGCRKSSPPGQCCHKNHRTGIVHCH